MAANEGLPKPQVDVEALPFNDDGAHVISHYRSFRGKVGKLPLKGSLRFVPRGSSGFDDIPIAEVMVIEPPALAGVHEVSAAPYDGQQADSAGEVHWHTWDDDAVVASVDRAIDYVINGRISPLFEQPDQV